MNLNTFARHGVFSSRKLVELIAARLRDPAEVRRARVLPYQLLMAWSAVDRAVPVEIKDALEDALEIALENVPRIEGKVFICADVSGSMASPVTGHRQGSTTKVRCVDVAALVAAAMLRVNDAQILPFDEDVVDLQLSRRASVMTNARRLAAVGGGGTNCSAPLAKLNREHARGRLVVLVSDNESWMDTRGKSTALMAEWEAFRHRNPEAKLVCLDLVPNKTTQAGDRRDILNIGGFSDAVFELLGKFVSGASPQHWVEAIEQVYV